MSDTESAETIGSQRASKDAKEWKFPEFRTSACIIGEFVIEDEQVRISIEELTDKDGKVVRFVRQDWATDGKFITYDQDKVGDLPELELTQEELVRIAKFGGQRPLIAAVDLALNHPEVEAPEVPPRDLADMLTFIGIKAPPDSGKTTFLSFVRNVLKVNVDSADLGNNYCLPLVNHRVRQTFGDNSAKVAATATHADVVEISSQMRNEIAPYENFPKGRVTLGNLLSNIHKTFPLIDAFAGRHFTRTVRWTDSQGIVHENKETKVNPVPRIVFFDTSGLPYLTDKRSDPIDEMAMGLDGIMEVTKEQLVAYVENPPAFMEDADKLVKRAVKVRTAFLDKITQMSKNETH